MASLEMVTEIVLKPMRALYRKPFDTDDPDGSLAEYAKALSEFEPDDLTAGWKELQRIYKKRDWPCMADLMIAIDLGQKAKAERARAAKPEQRSKGEIERERKALALETLRNTAFGRQVCNEGLAGPFVDDVVKTGQIPTAFDLIHLNRTRQRTLDALSYAEMKAREPGEWTELYANLVTLGQSILQRSDDLAREADASESER